jgi:hypothetical protein
MTVVIAAESAYMKLGEYDRTVTLYESELTFFSAERSRRVRFSRIRQPDLAGVRRLTQPLNDVLDRIAFHGHKRKALVLFLLSEMDRQQESFWGWDTWVELANCRRYDGNRLIAIAYFLCGFQSFSAFDKRRQVLFRLAERVFGATDSRL